MCAVDRGVPEEEREEEFDREPEPEDQYREQELPEGFENGKSNLTLWCIFNTQFFLDTTYWPVL